MSRDNPVKVSVPGSKKIRGGSRFPDGNREWLKQHAIAPNQAFLKIDKAEFTPFSTVFSGLRKWAAVLMAAFICLLPWGWFRQQQSLLREIKAEKLRSENLQNANLHLRGNLKQLSSMSLVQKSELNRMAAQLHDLAQRFHYQVNGFQRGAAMSDALQHVFENELGRLSSRYDLEVEALRKQVSEKEKMLSSLEYSLNTADPGVVVSADRFSASSAGMTNAAIAAINRDFQFVVVDAGGLKGIQAGQMVELYHQGALAGYGEVEKIYPEFSGVHVLSPEVLDALEKGDTVFLEPVRAA